MSPLIWPALAVGAVAGAVVGWTGARRRTPSGPGDWQRRIAARDRDLERIREEMADQSVALQEAEARIADLYHRLAEPTDGEPALHTLEAERQRARADALTERLRAAEDEIVRLRDRGDIAEPVLKPAAGVPDGAAAEL